MDNTLSAIRETRAELAGSSVPPDDTAPVVIGQILSWSSPLTLCIKTLAVDLAAGNTAVVHPSIQAPFSLVFLAYSVEPRRRDRLGYSIWFRATP